MTPRRLIRWKSFWFGILVLGFLAFCWALSLKGEHQMGFRVGSMFFGVSSQDETLMLFHIPFTGINFTPRSPWSPVKIEILGTAGFPANICQLAYWFVILLFLVPWSAFLTWRWRRQRILTKTNPLS